jgi:MFS transporter, DHA2 family, multidrug resistance protein
MTVEVSAPAAARRFATIAVMVATAMQAADTTIVNVALPRLQHDLGGGLSLGAWVMTSYLCATAVVAPLTGWLRRRFGTRRLFAVSITVFVAASLLCSFAPSAAAIILFRILQGLGGGVIHPLGQAMLLDVYPQHRHGRILAILGATVMLGPVSGPALGGIITDLASWRWVFAINLPLGALAIWGIVRLSLGEAKPAPDQPIDFIGILLLITGVGVLQLWLERTVSVAWLQSPELFTEAAIVAIAFMLMAVRARRLGSTILRLEVLKDLNFALAAFYNFILSAVLFTTIVFLPAIAQGPLGYDATVAGLTIVPRGALMIVAMLLVGQMTGTVNYRIVLATGWLLVAAGMVLLSAIPRVDGAIWIIAGSTLQAIGGGMLFTPLITLGLSTLPPELRTDATGLYSLLRQVGSASGLALMTSLLQVRIQAHLPALPAGAAGQAAPLPHSMIEEATLHAYAECFRVMVLAAVAVMPGVVLFRIRPAADPIEQTVKPAAEQNASPLLRVD